MRKLTALLLAFILGATVAIITAPKTSGAQGLGGSEDEKQYKTYRIDFNNNRQCEFCCCKPAEWYEFSARKSNGSVTRQYLCTACREFLRYK